MYWALCRCRIPVSWEAEKLITVNTVRAASDPADHLPADDLPAAQQGGRQNISNSVPAHSGSTGHVRSSTCILVQGNLSSSWAANLALAVGLGFICLGIGVAMAIFGYCMILPFAGLEVMFVTACLYWTVKKLSRREVITVDDRAITLEWGYNKPDVSVRLPRCWSKLEYRRPDTPLDIGAISLRAHGKRYAIGSSLGRDEKQRLYAELKKILT